MPTVRFIVATSLAVAAVYVYHEAIPYYLPCTAALAVFAVITLYAGEGRYIRDDAGNILFDQNKAGDQIRRPQMDASRFLQAFPDYRKTRGQENDLWPESNPPLVIPTRPHLWCPHHR